MSGIGLGPGGGPGEGGLGSGVGGTPDPPVATTIIRVPIPMTIRAQTAPMTHFFYLENVYLFSYYVLGK